MWILVNQPVFFIPLTSGVLQLILGICSLAPAALRVLTPSRRATLSPPPSCCWCARLCWLRMMWQCLVSPSECRCYRMKGFSLLKRFPLSAGAAARLLDQPVGDWLEHMELQQYKNKLISSGFDDLHYMVRSKLLKSPPSLVTCSLCLCAFVHLMPPSIVQLVLHYFSSFNTRTLKSGSSTSVTVLPRSGVYATCLCPLSLFCAVNDSVCRLQL